MPSAAEAMIAKGTAPVVDYYIKPPKVKANEAAWHNIFDKAAATGWSDRDTEESEPAPEPASEPTEPEVEPKVEADPLPQGTP